MSLVHGHSTQSLLERVLGNETRNRFLLFGIIGLMSLNYMRIGIASGGDLGLRMSEALYFMRGINPFRVYIGEIKPIVELGNPAAYPVWSYYYSYPFALLGGKELSRVVYSILDLFSIVFAALLVANRGESLSKTKLDEYWPVFLVLGISRFFYQQALYLNYHCQVALFIAVLFFGVSTARLAPIVVGGVLLAVKPSFAIPVYFFLVIDRQWRALALIGAILAGILLHAAYVLAESPFELLAQTWRAQQMWNKYGTGGVLTFLRPYLGENFAAVSAACGLMLSFGLLRLAGGRPWVSCAICISVSLSFFYNHVHAYTVAFVVLVVALKLCHGRSASIAFLLGFLFLDVPSLYAVFNSNLYLEIHAILRFAFLFLIVYLLFLAWISTRRD